MRAGAIIRPGCYVLQRKMLSLPAIYPNDMSIALTDISLSNFPEKISVKEMPGGEKVQIYFYGPKSYDNQLAVITHCLHGRDHKPWMS